jgi:hypothetical protein
VVEKGLLRKENPVFIIKDGDFIVLNGVLSREGESATGSKALRGIPEGASPQVDRA